MKRRLAQIERSISKYLDQLETADRQEPAIAEARTAHREMRSPTSLTNRINEALSVVADVAL